MTIKTGILAAVIGMGLVVASAQAGTIKIGFNVPLTGFAAADGLSAKTGAELAVEQINAAGGIKGDMLELVVYDDQASPKEAVPIAQKLIEKDKVIAGVSGSYSGSTRAAAGGISSTSVRNSANRASKPAGAGGPVSAKVVIAGPPPTWAGFRVPPRATHPGLPSIR